MTNNLIAVLGLFVGLLFLAINITRTIAKNDIPAVNFILMTLGWTVFISTVWIF